MKTSIKKFNKTIALATVGLTFSALQAASIADQLLDLSNDASPSHQFQMPFDQSTAKIKEEAQQRLAHHLIQTAQILMPKGYNKNYNFNKITDSPETEVHFPIRLRELESFTIKSHFFLPVQQLSLSMTGLTYDQHQQNLRLHLDSLLTAELASATKAQLLDSLDGALNEFKDAFDEATIAHEIGHDLEQAHDPEEDINQENEEEATVDLNEIAHDIVCYPSSQIFHYLKHQTLGKMGSLLKTLEEPKSKKYKEINIQTTDFSTKVASTISSIDFVSIFSLMEHRLYVLEELKAMPNGRKRYNALAKTFYGKDFFPLAQDLIKKQLVAAHCQELSDLRAIQKMLGLKESLEKFNPQNL